METKMGHEKNTFGYSPEEYRKFKKNAWVFLIMFTVLYCALYCTRNNLAAAAAQIMNDTGWGTDRIGILTSVLFWTYGIGQLVSGRLSEIFGSKHFLTLSVILSGAVNLLVGFANSFTLIVILWGLNGFFQSMAWGPGVACLMKWWPGSTHGFAIGFSNAAAGFGGAVSQLAVVFALKMSPGLGWRGAFFIPVIFPALVLIAFLLTSKASPAKIGLAEYSEDDPETVRQEEEMRKVLDEKGKLYPYVYLLKNSQFVIWLVIAFIAGVARYGLINWIPVYFVDRFSMDVTKGLIQSLILPVGMGFGTLIVPILTDKYWKNNRIVVVIASALISAVAVAAFLLLDPTVPFQFIVIEILLFVAGFFIYAINGTGFTFAADVGGRVFAGTSSGVFDFACYMGSAVQAIVFGFLQKTYGWTVVFFSIAAFLLIVTVLSAVVTSKKKKVTHE